MTGGEFVGEPDCAGELGGGWVDARMAVSTGVGGTGSEYNMSVFPVSPNIQHRY